MGIEPPDLIEMKHAMAGIAEITRAFYDELRKQEFTHEDALHLAERFMAETIRGASGE